MSISRRLAVSYIFGSAIFFAAGCSAMTVAVSSPTPISETPASSQLIASPSPAGKSPDTLGSPSPTFDPAVAAILADPNNQLALTALPPDHVALIGEDEAIQIAENYLNATGRSVGPVVLHGLASVPGSVAGVWVVIAKVPDMPGRPVGPPCATDPCEQIYVVNDYAVGVVSDQTGQVLRWFTTLRDVPAPSPT